MSKILYLEENKIVLANGVFGLGFHLELPEKYSMGESDYEDLNSYWHKSLKDLPDGSIFYKQDIFLKEELNTAKFRDSTFLEKATKDYFDGTSFLSHSCNLFFILPSQEIFNESLVNPFKKLNKKSFDDYDAKIISFTESVEQVILSLNSIKLQGGSKLGISEMSSSYLKNYYDLYFNLFDDSHISDRFFEQNHISIGDKYCALVCMLDEKKLPETLDSKRKDKYLSNDKTVFFRNYGENFSFDLDFSHIYNQIAVIDNNRKHLDNLKLTNDQLHKSSSFDKANLHFAKITDDIISDLVSNADNIRLIRGHNNIIVMADSEEELARNILKTNEQFRDIDIKPYIPKGNYLNAVFNYSFPFFSQYLTENQLYVSSPEIFCAFINNTGNYKNDNSGVMYNSRLSNVPLYIDLWDENRENINARNFTIYAPTGFGKSFNANHIIASNYSQGYKQVIIDLGGSYKKLAALFPDETAYITYEQGKSLGVNPFDFEILTTDVLEDLVEFVGVHYRRGGEVSEMEKTSLRKIIKYYDAKSSNLSLPNFVTFIAEQEQLQQTLDIEETFFNRKEFLHLMSEFVGEGAYSFLYKKTENNLGRQLMDKKIIIFELDQARENQLLLTVLLQLISTTINEVIWKDKSTKGMILFDEVAEQLQWDGVLRRIQYYFQAIRKQNGAVGMILQSESQLPDNPLSKAIVENTQILYVLSAKDYKSLQKRYGLSEHAYYQLCSIQSNFSAKRPYSEIFIMRGNKHQVYRLEVPKEVFWAYQTDGAENQKLLELYERTGDMETAINQFITSN